MVSIPYHTGTVGYQYDPTTDSYQRIIDGKPQIDPANSKQVYARNIVVMYQTVTLDPQTDPGYNRIILGNVGSGEATVFLEGKVHCRHVEEDVEHRPDAPLRLLRPGDPVGSRRDLHAGRTGWDGCHGEVERRDEARRLAGRQDVNQSLFERDARLPAHELTDQGRVASDLNGVASADER